MPTYEYACKSCGQHLEVVQSFHDDPLTVCPHCQGALRKVFGAVGITFKGSGFYKTDSRPRAKESSASSTSDSGSSDSGGSAESAGRAKSDSPKTDAPKAASGKSESPKSSPTPGGSSSSSGTGSTKSSSAAAAS